MARIQRLPSFGTAEEDVLFVEWRVAPGDAVRRGEAIAVIETLKAAFEIEAEHDGVLLRQLVAAGERVGLHTPIGIVGAADETFDDAAVAVLLAAEAVATGSEPPQPEGGAAGRAAARCGSTSSADAGSTPVAPAARRRAAELGVDLRLVAGTGSGGLVRAADVERTAGEARTVRRELPAAGDGVLDPEFLALLARDRAAFARLSSEFKVALLRQNGARIGRGCRLGQDAVLLVRRLVLGDDAFVGDQTMIEADELVAGALLHFGARCRVRCRRMQFGDNAFFADDVEIGGGGAMDPEAELVIGSHGFVGEHVHLNPCRPLRIGDEVVVSRSAVVMTHSFGGSVLRGHPNRFAGVAIGDGAQIGIGSVLFPGVEVGAGAILLSGSSLVSAVPAGRLFGGVPARDLKAAAAPPAPSERRELVRALLEEFTRQLLLRGRSVAVDTAGETLRLVVREADGEHVLEYVPDGAFRNPPDGGAELVRVAIEWPAATWQDLAADVVGVDLAAARIHGAQGPLADAWREFLRKRGVRLEPRAWTYRGGWL